LVPSSAGREHPLPWLRGMRRGRAVALAKTPRGVLGSHKRFPARLCLLKSLFVFPSLDCSLKQARGSQARGSGLKRGGQVLHCHIQAQARKRGGQVLHCHIRPLGRKRGGQVLHCHIRPLGRAKQKLLFQKSSFSLREKPSPPSPPTKGQMPHGRSVQAPRRLRSEESFCVPES
jgi:hypothetical protein